jgi:hypothetical protein
MSLPFLNTAPGYDEELRNSVFFERGLHATSICGAVGAAVAVAMLQGQDEAGIASAAGIAARWAPACWRPTAPAGPSSGSTAAGPRTAAWQRPTWPGTGSPARRPCWRAASGSCRRSAATAPTRTPSSAAWARTGSCRAWSSSRTRATTSPTRAWTPPCGCAPRGSPPADVTAIELGVAKPVLRTIAEPPEAKARPASGYHAAFSGPYTVAAVLLGGGLGVSHEDFTDAAARDPRRLALAALVRCVEDERCSASFPHAFPAVLRVTTRNGRGTRGPRRGQPRRPRQPPVRRGAGEEVPRQRREVPPGGARGRARGPNARPS